MMNIAHRTFGNVIVHLIYEANVVSDLRDLDIFSRTDVSLVD
jgi:hypothetical protein